MPDEKYKHFRQFMCNDLGITRQDIEEWTKQATATEVLKKLGQMNIEKMVQDSILKFVRDAVNGYNTSGLKEALARELVNKFQVSVKQA